MKKIILISTILILILTGIFVGPKVEFGNNNPVAQFFDTITIGPDTAEAAGVADYTCDGTNDNVQFTLAINALPAGGGKLTVLAGTYSFGATVTRAIANVSIEGMGLSTYFTYNGVDPIFTIGGNYWEISSLRTDAGGIETGGFALFTFNNCLIGAQYYSYNSPMGTASLENAYVSSLTDGRVTFAGASDQLVDDAGLTYNSGTNTLTAGSVVDGTRDLGDATTPMVARVYASDAILKPAETDEANLVWLCDGTADESQINTAIAVVTAAGGGFVELSTGKFVVTGTATAGQYIAMASGVTLKGQGYFATEIEASAAMGGANYRLVDVTGTSGTHLTDIQIEGIYFDALDPTNADTRFIQGSYVDNLDIKDCYFYGGPTNRYGEIYITHITNSTMTRCRFNYVYNVQFSGTSGGSTPDTYTSHDILVEGNQWYNNGNTFCIGNQVNRLQVLNNVFKDGDNTAIDICGSPNSIISGNVIEGFSENYGIYVEGAYDIAITGNTIQNCYYGIGLIDNSSWGIGRNALISNNVLRDIDTNTASDGIVLTGYRDCVIRGNTLNGIGRHGIAINAKSTIYSVRNIIEGNAINNWGKFNSNSRGVYVNSNSSYNVVCNNSFAGKTQSNYTIGTVTFTQASTVVVGSGTTWTVDMIGRLIKSNSTGTYYEITAFTDATHITIGTAYATVTENGVAYTITCSQNADGIKEQDSTADYNRYTHNTFTNVTTKISPLGANDYIFGNDGYIGAGERGVIKKAISAGIQDTVTSIQNTFGRNLLIEQAFVHISAAASATAPTYDMGLDADGAGAPSGASLFTAIPDTVGYYSSTSNGLGGGASGVQTNPLVWPTSGDDWVNFIITDAAGEDMAGNFYLSVIGL